MNQRAMKKTSSNEYWISLAQKASVVSGVFSLIVAGFLVFNYISAQTGLPEKELLYSQRMAEQKALLDQNPKDEAVIQEVRRLDLQLRQTYFYRLFFSERGKYLLLGGVLISLVSLQIASALRNPPRKPRHPIDPALETQMRKRSGAAVGAMGAILLGGLFVLASTSRNDLASQTLTPPESADNATASEPDYASWDEIRKNWPTFRGPGGLGVSAFTSVPDSWDEASGENVLWKTPIPLPGHNSPIVWGDRIFLTGGDDTEKVVYCFSLETGEILWQDRMDDPPSTGGEEIRVFEDNGWATSTMACDGHRVYAIFANGMAAGYDLTGKKLWSKNLGAPDSSYGYASSLTAYHDLMLIQYDQAQAEDQKSVLYALQGQTGEVAWQVPRPVANSWTSPIVVDTGEGEQLITVSEPWIIAYNPASGEELWKAKLMGTDLAPSPVYANGIAYVIQPNDSVFAIRTDGKGDVTRTHVAWTASGFIPDICSPLTNGELIFLLSTYGTMTCLDAKTGEFVWEEDIEDSFMTSPSLVGEWVYLFSETGKLYRVKASREFEVTNTGSLDDRFLASPAFLDGKIVVRGEFNLYCLGRKQ
ncbi:MAG: PQQ-binding-like beta-propeller repeat protein [bacterium]|nr:PQQ-binding-like beta-propeller repeat protein [bacterium]